MVDLVFLQSVSYIAAAVGVCIAAIYYVLNLRTAIKTREAQLFMQVFDRFREQDFWEGINETRKAEFDEFLEWTQTKMSFDEFNKLNSISAYFEGVGVLLKRGYIDVDLINDFMPITILTYFENIKPYIQWRIDRSSSTYRWKNYQYLYRVVKDTHERRLKSYDKYLMTQNGE